MRFLNRKQSKIADAKNAKKMTKRIWWRGVSLHMIIASVLLSACAVIQSPERRRIALFAPFEGRYREVGYNALYGARLAVSDILNQTVDLLAVDDGGTQAVSHAAALAQDPLVMAVVVLGYDGTTPEALAAFGDIPVLVVGNWGAQPTGDNVFIYSNPEIDEQLTVSARISVLDAAASPAPLVGGEVFALDGFVKLRDSLDGVTVVSSGMPPDVDFAARYKASDPFAPEPGLLATLTHQAIEMAIFWSGGGTREKTQRFIAMNEDFTDGYWNDAEIHRYRYIEGALTEDIVE